MKDNSKGITILLPNGDPNGVKIIELLGWTGKIFMVPRAKLNEVKDMDGVNSPAIYFLIDTNHDISKNKLYIGESENFFNRLLTHDNTKDFWDVAIVFSGSLNKAEVKYLENKSIILAKDTDRYEVMNGNTPVENTLSSFQKSAVENYFDNLKLILSILGFTFFQKIPEKHDAKVYEFSDAKNKAADGKGSLLDSGEFIVYKGSLSRIKETPSFEGYGGSLLRKRLENEGVLKRINNESFIFESDYVFKSPSAAADCVAGRSCNGWSAWKDKEGKTLDENIRKQQPIK